MTEGEIHTTPKNQRNLIFLCYSRKDNDRPNFREELETCLYGVKAAQTTDFEFEFFSDQDIPVGERWLPAIREKLDRTRVAVLLEGPGFMTTDFIMPEELPRFLAAERDRTGITIFRIPVRAVPEAMIPRALQQFQSAWDLNKPLARLNGRSAREAAIKTIIDLLVKTYYKKIEARTSEQDEMMPLIAQTPESNPDCNNVDAGEIKQDEMVAPPFTIDVVERKRTISLFPSILHAWVNSKDFQEVGVTLHPGVRKLLRDHANAQQLIQPAWKLELPPETPMPLCLHVDKCRNVEKVVARLYPRFRDAQLALFTCLHERYGNLEFENLKHAKGVMRALFRKHLELWEAGKALSACVPEFEATDYHFGSLRLACRSIPLCELGILQRLSHACVNPGTTISIAQCYILLDRICHWLLMINRYMNRIIDSQPPVEASGGKHE